MKKLTLLLVFATVVFAVNAQLPLNLGLKAGYSTSKIRFNKDQFDEGNVNNFIIGAWGRINIKKFHIQPEAYFTSKGGDLEEVADGGKSSFDMNTIDVPVLLGYRLINLPLVNVRLNAGPVFSFATKREVDSPDFNKDDMKESFVGVQYGAGADFLFLTLDLRFENSLGNIVKNADFGNGKSRAFLVTVGFKIL